MRNSALAPRLRVTVLLLGCAPLVMRPGPDLHAQTVLFRPHAGLNLPTRISLRSGGLQVSQKIGLTVGARLILRFNPRFDVNAAVSYSPGYAVLRGAGQRVELGGRSHSLDASTGARYWLLPPPRQLSWEVHARAGMAFGGTPSYADLFETSTITGVLGTALNYRLGRLVILKLRIQQRLYRLHVGEVEPVRSGSPLRVTFGLGLPFLESAR